MSIVKDYYIGATHVVIKDDYYCSKEEIPKILEEIGELAYEALYLRNKSSEASKSVTKPR